MTEELLMQYAALRALKLGMNGAQKWNYTQRVVQHWLSGEQAESALTKAIKEVSHAN